MLQTTEVDGVTTLVVPTSGPSHAGLTFRVGRADETLAGAGITHLVEHLALFRHGLTDYHFNGGTGPVLTHFYMQGTEEAVVAFLNEVCRSLLDLPMERLTSEKEILRTEWAGRGGGPADAMPLWRYGARDYGLVSYPELGLARLTEDDLRQWIQTWFTRENAVLWIAGPQVPAGLRLELPGGTRRPVPTPSSALPTTPAYFTGNGNGVVLDGIVRRRTATQVFAQVLERELFRSLRQEAGLSYTAQTSYDVRGDGFATITAAVDALPENREAALGAVVDVLAKLRVGRIEQGDLDSVRTKAEEALRHPDRNALALPMYAMDMLTGVPLRTAERIREELNSVTVEDLHAVAVEFNGSALVMAPNGCTVDWAGHAAAPVRSTSATEGRRFRSLQDDGRTLIVGEDGASIVDAGGAVTVRYDTCMAALSWPDGARQLIGADAITVHIEPTLFAVDAAVLATIDAALPATTVVPMPARSAAQIPTPQPTTKGRRSRRSLVRIITLSVAAAILASVAGLLTAGATTAEPGTPEAVALHSPGLYGVVGTVWLIAAFLAVRAFVIARRRT